MRDARDERMLRRLEDDHRLVAQAADEFPSAVHDLLLHSVRVCLDIVQEECSDPSPDFSRRQKP